LICCRPVLRQSSTTRSLAEQFLAEVSRLQPWSNETRAARGRTLFGVTGADANQVDEVARALAQIVDSGNVVDAPVSAVEWKFPMPLLIRHLADDMRTYYHEAIASQPGSQAPNHDALSQWIFDQSSLGQVLLEIDKHLAASDDKMASLVRGLLVPHGSRSDH